MYDLFVCVLSFLSTGAPAFSIVSLFVACKSATLFRHSCMLSYPREDGRGGNLRTCLKISRHSAAPMSRLNDKKSHGKTKRETKPGSGGTFLTK